MNKNQKRVIIIISIVLFLMLLFPPFHFRQYNSGYSFILNPPKSGVARIDLTTLFAQYLFTITIGFGLFFIFEKNRD